VEGVCPVCRGVFQWHGSVRFVRSGRLAVGFGLGVCAFPVETVRLRAKGVLRSSDAARSVAVFCNLQEHQVVYAESRENQRA
jgi:hypothetical protein